MELLAVRTARLLAFFPTDEINPRGRSLTKDVIPAFIEKYGFLKFPQKAEEYDETRGVRFENGVWGKLDFTVVLYNNGFMVDTRSSTDDCEKILAEMLVWGSETFDLVYKPTMLQRKSYLSELDIMSETSLDALNPRLEAFAGKLSDTVAKIMGTALDYRTAALGIYFDSSFSKAPSGPFRVERIVNLPYSENKYYASAPLPTNTHLEFLEEFEAILKG